MGSVWIGDVFHAYEEIVAWLGEEFLLIAALAFGRPARPDGTGCPQWLHLPAYPRGDDRLELRPAGRSSPRLPAEPLDARARGQAIPFEEALQFALA